MRYLSLFSGIEAASVAWEPLGWIPVAFAEVDKFPCAVLAHHYPAVPNLGDVTRITEQQIQRLGPIDLVVFGSPCQDVSVAGKREGLKGERSGLFFDAMRIVRWSGARYAVFENVPGLFSSNDGRDFASVVGEMVGVSPDVPDGGWQNAGVFLGPNGLLEYAVLDAQYFGVPQRRRRVFAVADFGDWSSRPPILLEPNSMCGNTQAGQEARAPVAALTSTGVGTCGADDNQAQAGHLIAPTIKRDYDIGYGDAEIRGGLIASTGDLSHCLNAGGMHRQDFETETLISPTLRAGGNTSGGHRPPGTDVDTCESLIVTHPLCARYDSSEDGCGRGIPLVAPTLKSKYLCEHSSLNTSAVRRLTPVECARLQGFQEIERSVLILVCCSDLLKNSALAEIRSLRSQASALPVVDRSLKRGAGRAESHSNIRLAGQDWPVAVDVLTNFGRQEVRLRSQDALLWSASHAADTNSSLLRMPQADFVRLSALTMGCLVPTTLTGLVDATQASIFPATGTELAALSVNEIMELARDADALKRATRDCMMSITSQVLPDSPHYEQNLATWSCCAAAAIASFIQNRTLTASSFALRFTSRTEYLDVPFRGKPAADGNKYKALGNSMAVPVMAYIGKRIDLVDKASRQTISEVAA